MTDLSFLRSYASAAARLETSTRETLSARALWAYSKRPRSAGLESGWLYFLPIRTDKYVDPDREVQASLHSRVSALIASDGVSDPGLFLVSGTAESLWDDVRAFNLTGWRTQDERATVYRVEHGITACIAELHDKLSWSRVGGRVFFVRALEIHEAISSLKRIRLVTKGILDQIELPKARYMPERGLLPPKSVGNRATCPVCKGSGCVPGRCFGSAGSGFSDQ